jgi:hypothetical protein
MLARENHSSLLEKNRKLRTEKSFITLALVLFANNRATKKTLVWEKNTNLFCKGFRVGEEKVLKLLKSDELGAVFCNI